VLSLPGGVFSAAGAGVKTNLLFFTKGKPTERIWYYDLSDVKVGKKSPLTLKHFEDFAAQLLTRGDSDGSWTIDLTARRAKASEEARPFRETARAKAREATSKADDIENAVYDLKAVNPNRTAEIDRRTPGDLLDLVEAKGVEIADALKQLRALTS
jgi:type I restriction enzyme M protein